MSFYDYQYSKRLGGGDIPFYALIMAAMRRASSENKERLQAAFPDVWAELQARYQAPAGALTVDELVVAYRMIEAERAADLAAGKEDGFYPATAGLFVAAGEDV